MSFLTRSFLTHTPAFTNHMYASWSYMCSHYNAVIMSAMASQITSLTIVYSTVYSGADQRKYQSSAPQAFVWGFDRWIPRTKGQWRGKCFHLVTSSWITPEVSSNYSQMRGPGMCLWFADRSNPESKVYGANMGPTWVMPVPDGPNVGPINLAIRELYRFRSHCFADQLYYLHWPVWTYQYTLLCNIAGRYTSMQPKLLTPWLQVLSYRV